MDLAINRVLVAPPLHSNDETPARFTIVEYQYGSDVIVLCQQDRKRPKKPFLHLVGSPIKVSHCATCQAVDWHLFSVESQNFLDADHIRYYNDLELWKNCSVKQHEKLQKRREKFEKKVTAKLRVVDSFEQIIQRKFAFFKGELPTQSLKAFAKTLGVSYDFVWDTLSIYYAFGQCEEALIPTYANCGRNISMPENHEIALEKFITGRGRKRKFNNAGKRPTNQQDLKNVESFVDNSLPHIQYFSFKGLCEHFNSEFATKVIYEDDFGRKVFDYVPEKFLTVSQFKTLLRKACKTLAKFERIKIGAKEFRNKLKTQTSTVMKHVVGPSHVYEIDATVLDVHLISKYCTDEKLNIERPILYSVVDVATNNIVGFHLSLNGALLIKSVPRVKLPLSHLGLTHHFAHGHAKAG